MQFNVLRTFSVELNRYRYRQTHGHRKTHTHTQTHKFVWKIPEKIIRKYIDALLAYRNYSKEKQGTREIVHY